MADGKSKWAASAGAAGGGGLMWATEKWQWQWPDWIVTVVFVFSIACLLAAMILWARDIYLRLCESHIIAEGGRPFSRLIPLKEAARIAYEETRGTLSAKMAERDDDGPNGILTFYYYVLTQAPAVRIYARRLPSTKFEMISEENQKKYQLSADLSAYEDMYKKGSVVFDDVRVKKSDLKRKIKEVKNYSIENG